ncbi:P-loop containing nucleoside triphosphate hydrolase [Pseudocohnilembus persalinus]|uniref:p-loop containing nucleoside triphosphate hydrolase n=1 Tax=Pseudocohnilembus persalinus TaxID=266149 RepID=A0A0V0QBG4_PSEPJ|nr:P-loop containing nucleoside triphosphate hydrolase [Pseudocohnilembus persalinus]|eukprot:KRW99396.1 P-loop containing nucleoside triphosphate hydrolase [Pseudocohnilembus persalinus]
MLNKKIAVVTRIKASRGNHLATNLSRAQSPNRKKSLVSPKKINLSQKLSCGSQNSITQKSHTIFCAQAADQKGKMAQLIAVNENQIKGQLLDQYVKNDEDLVKLQNSILEGAKLYKYDRVFGPKTTQEKLYNQICKPRIAKTLEGISQTFLFMGPQNGGKQQSFRGGENEEQGCIFRGAQELLNLIEIQRKSFKNPKKQSIQLLIQICAVNDNNIIDLLQKPHAGNVGYLGVKQKRINLENCEDQNQNENLFKLEIKSMVDFRALYRHAINVYFQLPQEMKKQNVCQDSHLFVRFTVAKDRRVFSRQTYVKFGDFKTQSEGEYKILSNFLCDISYQKPDRLMSNPHYNQNKLINLLVDSLNRMYDNQCVVFNCVSSNPQQFEESVKSLQYSHKLRDRIEELSEFLIGKEYNLGPRNEEDILNDPRNIIDDEEIESEIDFLLKQVFSFDNITQDFTKLEKLEWLTIQQKRLLNLQQEILTMQNTNKFQKLEKKLEEAKLYIIEIEKIIDGGRKHSQANSEGGSPRRYRTIAKDLEDELFKELSQSPKATRQSKIVSPKNNQNTMRSFRSASPKPDPQMKNQQKKQLMHKIEQAISDSREQRHRSRSTSRHEQQRKQNYSQFEVVSPKQPYRPPYDAYSASLELERERLNSNLMEHIQDLENKIQMKNRILQEQNMEIQERERNLLKEQELNIAREERQSLMAKTEEELRAIVTNLKIKLAKKKHDAVLLQEQNHILHEEKENEKCKATDIQIRLEREIEDLQHLYQREKIHASEVETLLQKTRSDMEYQIKSRQIIEESCSENDRRVAELTRMLHDEQDQNKDLKISNQLLDKKIEDLLNKNEILSKKVMKQKQKFETEKQELMEQKSREVQQRRLKNKKLKGEMKDIYEKLNGLTSQEKLLRQQNINLERMLNGETRENKQKVQEITELNQEIQYLRTELDKNSQFIRELEDQLKASQYENEKCLQEQKQMVENLDDKDRVINNLDLDLQAKSVEIEQYEKEIDHLNEKIQAQQSLIDKIESQNKILSELQENDFSKLNQRVQMVNEELQRYREENISLKQEHNQLLQELEQTQGVCENQKERLHQNKVTIYNQQQQIQEMDEIIKEFIQQKNQEIRDIQLVDPDLQRSAEKIQHQIDQQNFEDERYLEMSEKKKQQKLRELLRLDESDEEDEINTKQSIQKSQSKQHSYYNRK